MFVFLQIVVYVIPNLQMKKITFLLILLVSIVNSRAQVFNFSDSTLISLLTCSPGQEAYAKFGHTGIRLSDPISKVDVVFNYGLFSFETNNFYLKFIKGETDYLLGVNQTPLFLAEYEQRNSTVWEQDLDLSIIEKRTLINLLLENLKPENRKYRYNFVFDNCATRPRDKILDSVNGFISFKVDNNAKTYREWVGEFVGEDTWLKFGIDLVFGRDADKTTPQFESMFLPIVLMSEFQNTKVLRNKDLPPTPLVKNYRILIDPDVTKEDNQIWYLNPLFILGLISLLGILSLLIEYRVAHYKPVIDSLTLIITGAAGWLITYLMFFSVHPLVHHNFNLLWLNPINLIVGLLIWVKPLRKAIYYYSFFNLGLLLLALLVLVLSVQEMNTATYPIIALLIIRNARWSVRTKHKYDRKRKYSKKNGYSK